MRILVLSGAITALITSPVNSQRLPNFDVPTICAAGAKAVSVEDCKNNTSSMFCNNTGQRAIEKLCVILDQKAKSDLMEQWDTIQLEQKQTCIIYVLMNQYLSFSALKHCVDGEVRIDPIIDDPGYLAEYWFDGPTVIVPRQNLKDCNETRKRAGNIGFCIARSHS